jgi:glycine dehydrogenase subunit 1
MQSSARGRFASIGSTPVEEKSMLEAANLQFEDIVQCLPKGVCLAHGLSIPEGLAEDQLIDEWDGMMAKNSAPKKASLIGAGAYMHVVPSTVAHLASLPGFVTAYTPYQPELSQGTLQALFEYQSFMVELCDMELANCSLYDGASAAAEAVLMTERIRKSGRVLVAQTMHPNYVATIRTYVEPHGIAVDEVAADAAGQVSPGALRDALAAHEYSAVLVQSPNYYGIVEDFATLADEIHKSGALFVQSFTEAVALGLLRYGMATGADIVVGEGQSLGLPLSFGGPHLGIFATLKKFSREFPGRIVGETVDTEGRTAYVMTLRAREQDIRREKATSNICSNHALNAIRAAIFLGSLGREGFRSLALENVAKLQRLVDGLESSGRFVRVFGESPVFNEAILASGMGPEDMRSRLAGLPVFPPLHLTDRAVPDTRGKPHRYLFCATELLKEHLLRQVVGALS